MSVLCRCLQSCSPSLPIVTGRPDRAVLIATACAARIPATARAVAAAQTPEQAGGDHSGKVSPVVRRGVDVSAGVDEVPHRLGDRSGDLGGIAEPCARYGFAEVEDVGNVGD